MARRIRFVDPVNSSGVKVEVGTSKFAETASFAITASHALTQIEETIVTTEVSSSYAENADFATTASHALTALTSSYIKTAETASYVKVAQTASYVKVAQTASYAFNAVNSSFALTASYALNAVNSIGNGSGSVNNGVVTVDSLNTPYNISNFEFLIKLDASSGTLNLNLPTSSLNKGRQINFKVVTIPSSPQDIIFNTSGTDLIDGKVNYSGSLIDSEYEAISMICDGEGNWWIF